MRRLLAACFTSTCIFLAAAPTYAQWSPAATSGIYYPGRVGIGTDTPNNSLTVLATGIDEVGSTPRLVMNFRDTSGSKGMYLGYDAASPLGIIMSHGGSAGMAFWTHNGAAWGERMRVHTNGFVGIGTAAPSTRLHVEGDVTVTGNIAAKYQDVAEWVPSKNNLSAGTVVILDPDASNQVTASVKPYDTSVAGVVSEMPGVLLGEAAPNREKVATFGRVKVKADASNGPIRVGDLLVTGSSTGRAMKSLPIEIAGTSIHRPGTIIGKALEPLADGEGEILVLLSLQ